MNCIGDARYQYGINGSVTSELLTNMSAIFYLWGDQSYNFTLKAANIDGQLSAPASLSGRSRQLGKSVNES